MTRRARLPLYVLLACALFVRLSIPAGWMPATGAGLFAIEPCVAAAPVAMPQHDAAHHHSHKYQQHDGDCAFSPLAAAAAPADLVPTLLPPLAAEATHHRSVPMPFFATGPPSPPPPATGPPALA